MAWKVSHNSSCNSSVPWSGTYVHEEIAFAVYEAFILSALHDIEETIPPEELADWWNKGDELIKAHRQGTYEYGPDAWVSIEEVKEGDV